MKAKTKTQPTRSNMWGGRFATAADARLKRFNDSFSFDWKLLEEDIAGSIAWAGALGAAGVLSQREERRVVRALRELFEETKGLALPLDDHEDVHSFVETALASKVGPLAKKLHTGRSRNDQVATDLRLWLADATLEATSHVAALAQTLVALAKSEAATPMPGYTHLKQAEPVTFGHWCLAYVEMLFRDADRFLAAYGRGDECPLGSGALAGSPVEVDRDALAAALGFSRPTANSLDAVSDRDFAADYLYASTLMLTHLSRLAEDLIFFSSDEAGYVELPDAMSTGSSRMPQKKNPDVLELVRGHAARAIGETTGFLALLKGLPLAYDKDLQLDKEPLFRMRDTLSTALPALDALVAGLELNRDRMREAASSDLLLATAVADALASRGVAFREAHDIVGKRVAEAIATKKTLKELGPGGGITAADLKALDPSRSVAAKKAIGGTAPARVRKAAAAAAKRAVALARLVVKETQR